ncbi:MAG: gliding motility-related protein [Chlorobi bacterium OLB6]|nr:MAG: gliding motility-related protein [Chlorobi bacterium OLB6]
MLDNSYFRYEVRLDPNPATNPQIIGGNPDKGWYLFRIPVRRPDTVVGNPLYTNIQYVRLAFRGGRVKLAIADWSVVGSYWLARHNFQPGLRETDSVLQVAYVNREENQDAPRLLFHATGG